MKIAATIRFYSVFCVLLIMLSSQVGMAQQPCLTIDKTLGCEPLSITVTNCSGSSAIYDYEYDGITPRPESNTSHTYMVTDTAAVCQQYSILQIIGTSGSGASDSVFENIIRVCRPVAPEISVLLCDNNRVVLETNDTVYNSIRVDLGDGNVITMLPTATVTYQYPSSSSFTIRAEGLFDGTIACGTVDININPSATIPLAELTTAATTTSGDITLDFQLSEHVRYILEEKIGTGTFQTVQVLDNSATSITLTGKTLTEEYTYRIASFNPCTAVTTYSEEIPVLPATLTAESDANAIRWTSYQAFGVINYQIVRDNFITASFTDVTTEYLDDGINCGQEYCYYLVINMTQNRKTTLNLGCVTSLNSNQPIIIESALASVIDGKLAVNWSLNSSRGIASITLNKTAGFQPNPTSFNDMIAVSGLQYVDSIIDPSLNQICYQLEVLDSCDNKSRSVIFCNLLLRVQKQGLDNRLTWNEFFGLGTAMEFVIEILDENGNVQDSYPALSFDTFDYLDPSSVLIEPIRRYRIKAVSTADPQLFAYSNIVEIAEKLELLIPEAFTPNNDGLNDQLEIQGAFLNTLQLEIYNRWGVKVYSTTNLEEAWDGSYEGQPVPQGAYNYIIQGTDSFGGVFVQKGTVMVLR